MNNTTIAELIEMMNKIRDEKGFKDTDTPPVLAKSIVIEANELLEEIYKSTSNENLNGEIADVFMYLLALVDYYQLDVKDLIENKIKIVQKRVYE